MGVVCPAASEMWCGFGRGVVKEVHWRVSRVCVLMMLCVQPGSQ